MPTGRKLGYGALADKAATLRRCRTKSSLKDPKDFKLIGTPAKRLDTPDKVNGKAEFGIDVKIPGMKIATVAACPVFGGKLKRVDDSKAKAVKGVRQIVRLDDAVAVIADHMGAAKKGLAALDIAWDGGPNAKFSSADLVARARRGLEEAGRGRDAGRRCGQGHGRRRADIEAVYQLPFLAHATMEPMNCTVHVRPDGCDVWVGTQVDQPRPGDGRAGHRPAARRRSRSTITCSAAASAAGSISTASPRPCRSPSRSMAR